MRLTIERTGGHRLPGAPVAHPGGTTLGALARLIGGIAAAWRCRLRRTAAIRELRAWDDRMLKDVGLTRGEIRAAVDGEMERGRPLRRRPRRPGA